MKRKSKRAPMVKERTRSLSGIEKAMLEEHVAILDKNNRIVATEELPNKILAMKEKHMDKTIKERENKRANAKLKITERRLLKKAA